MIVYSNVHWVERRYSYLKYEPEIKACLFYVKILGIFFSVKKMCNNIHRILKCLVKSILFQKVCEHLWKALKHEIQEKYQQPENTYVTWPHPVWIWQQNLDFSFLRLEIAVDEIHGPGSQKFILSMTCWLKDYSSLLSIP